jgi:hypothetical protein
LRPRMDSSERHRSVSGVPAAAASNAAAADTGDGNGRAGVAPGTSFAVNVTPGISSALNL